MREKGHSDKGTDSLRITEQFRTREGMAYEMRERGERLTVLITESQQEGWHVEAFASRAPGNSISQSAATRREALRRTGAQWAIDAAGRGLPTFDWEAVASALTIVRAI